MKLATNIQHVSGHWRKGFQGQSSKVKVTTRPNAKMAEAYISMVWCRDTLVFVLYLSNKTYTIFQLDFDFKTHKWLFKHIYEY